MKDEALVRFLILCGFLYGLFTLITILPADVSTATTKERLYVLAMRIFAFLLGVFVSVWVVKNAGSGVEGNVRLKLTVFAIALLSVIFSQSCQLFKGSQADGILQRFADSSILLLPAFTSMAIASAQGLWKVYTKT